MDEKAIMQELKARYEAPYKSQSEETKVDSTDFKNFCHNLQLPILSDLERDELEGKLTLKECKEILKTFPLGKSLAEEGFTVEFFNCFVEIFGQDL